MLWMAQVTPDQSCVVVDIAKLCLEPVKEALKPDFLPTIWEGLHGAHAMASRVKFVGNGVLPSIYAVEDLAAAAVAAAGLAISELLGTNGTDPRAVTVDRKLASLWYGWSVQPI